VLVDHGTLPVVEPAARVVVEERAQVGVRRVVARSVHSRFLPRARRALKSVLCGFGGPMLALVASVMFAGGVGDRRGAGRGCRWRGSDGWIRGVVGRLGLFSWPGPRFGRCG